MIDSNQYPVAVAVAEELELVEDERDLENIEELDEVDDLEELELELLEDFEEVVEVGIVEEDVLEIAFDVVVVLKEVEEVGEAMLPVAIHVQAELTLEGSDWQFFK